MGKIFYMFGKSASGKDTLFEMLIRDGSLALSPLVFYTTRPKRDGETQGKEYFFTDKQHLCDLREQGKVIEERVYHTVYGDWYYFTADDGNIRDDETDYLGIGTLESFLKLKAYYGGERVVPLYITVEPYTRLLRALSREKNQKNPAYAEMCRRFLADEEDFSDENLKKAGISTVFPNDTEISACFAKLKEAILSERSRA